MELIGEYRPLLATLAGIAAILVLILRVRMDAFAALLLAAIGAALLAGLSPDAAFGAVQSGMGGTLGFIAPVVGLGALFGAILQAGGGIEALARGVADRGAPRSRRFAMGGLGLVAATPVFFDVALIILLPFIVGLAKRASQNPLSLGLPLAVGLAAGHAFIPPTPGPMAIADLVGADLGWVVVFGLITGLVSVAVAGPVFTGWLERRGRLPASHPVIETSERAPSRIGFGVAATLILLPLILILGGTFAKLALSEGSGLRYAFSVVGHPFSALLIASGAAWVVLRSDAPESRAHMRDVISRALAPTAVVILVTGAGGAFKQVLVDTGAGAQLAGQVLTLGLSPLLAGWALALLVRLAQGSATVAMITAAGLVAPIAAAAGLSAPELGLLTVAIAAGATGFSHVNDSGFWLVSRLFGISERDTLRTWTVGTGLVALTGLAAVALMSLLV